MKRTIVFLILFVLTLLLLGGCGAGDGQTQPEPSPAPSSPATPAPTPVPEPSPSPAAEPVSPYAAVDRSKLLPGPLLIDPTLFDPCERPGTLEVLCYDYPDASGKSAHGEMTIYLPYSYRPTQQYPVLVLIQGLNASPSYWFEGGHNLEDGRPVTLKPLYDNLIDRGEIEPLILVALAYESGTDKAEHAACYLGHEILFGVFPALVEKYAVYTATDETGETVIDRAHTAMAGFSFGSSAIYKHLMKECLPRVSAFGCFSGNVSDCTLLGQELIEVGIRRCPLLYLYDTAGEYENSSRNNLTRLEDLLAACSDLAWDVNVDYQVMERCNHTFSLCAASLHNYLHILSDIL